MEISNPAGFWIRLGAGLLDLVIIGLPLGVVSYLISGGLEGDSVTNLVSFLYYLLVPVVWYGYTVGKKLLGIRIVKVDGTKVGIGTMLMRMLIAAIVYGITLGIAVIASAFMVGFRKDKRSVHDLIAGTYVTFDKP